VVDLVAKKRDENGRWPLENPHPGPVHFEAEYGKIWARRGRSSALRLAHARISSYWMATAGQLFGDRTGPYSREGRPRIDPAAAPEISRNRCLFATRLDRSSLMRH
jgi:hypothetical protein